MKMLFAWEGLLHRVNILNILHTYESKWQFSVDCICLDMCCCCVVVLLCCWMRCTTWIGSFLIYMLVQLCYFMCPCSCGTTICMQYVLIIYGMSFVGQPRVAMSNITSSRNCIAYTSSKYFNWRNSYPLVTIRGVQKNDPYQLGPLWQMTPSLGLFIK
jgi:hypothetical protein